MGRSRLVALSILIVSQVTVVAEGPDALSSAAMQKIADLEDLPARAALARIAQRRPLERQERPRPDPWHWRRAR